MKLVKVQNLSYSNNDYQAMSDKGIRQKHSQKKGFNWGKNVNIISFLKVWRTC